MYLSCGRFVVHTSILCDICELWLWPRPSTQVCDVYAIYNPLGWYTGEFMGLINSLEDYKYRGRVYLV